MQTMPGPPTTVADKRVRRLLLSAAFGLAASPAGGQPRTPLIAFLGGARPDPEVVRNQTDALRQGLAELGRAEGRDYRLEARWAEGDPTRLPALLAELLKLKPDVLVTAGAAPVFAVKAAAVTLPTVAVAIDNPVEMGLAQSYARPGGHITGLSGFGIELVTKRLELLKELVPSARKVAVLMNPHTLERAGIERDLKRLGGALALMIFTVEADAPAQFDAAFKTVARERADGILVLADATFYTHRARLGELCARLGLPSIWGHGDYLSAGGLASYQSDFAAMFRRSAGMVDQILRGANPAEMPFEQATKLHLVLNLKAARALGITVPRALLLRADEVIE